MFTGGQELAHLAISSGLLRRPWAAILQLFRDTNHSDPTLPFSIRYSVYQDQEHPSNGTIIAFVSSPPFTAQHLEGEGGRDLVSSATLREHFPLFEFVSTKVNPSFFIHRVALTLFESVWEELSSLKDKYVNSPSNTNPLIVTGHSIGGSVAALFTLLLLENISPKTTSRPLCINFGSPLIGDNGFQQAISERPAWNSCFLHVVSNQDPIPKLPQGLSVGSSSHASTIIYKPFGTFLFCCETGFALFEEPETIVDLILAISSGSTTVGNRYSKEIIVPYGEILEKLERGALCREITELGDWNFSPLHTGIFLQLEAIKVKKEEQLLDVGRGRRGGGGNGDDDVNSGLITEIVKRSEDLVARKKNVFDPDKKLNEMKINMTYLEWFKKRSEGRGGCYYDVFKNVQSKPREEAVKRKSFLTDYWERRVKQETSLRDRWLYAGTNYRRMVEPLDIAEWYKKGKKDYVAAGRSEHYKVLEKWLKDEEAVLAAGRRGINNANDQRRRGCSLTEDSCFWAYVEEANIISRELLSLEDGVTTCSPPEDYRESTRENLLKFEKYVWEMINNYAVAPEIFSKQSSFMQWWEAYDKIVAASPSNPSPLVDFMRKRGYLNYD